MATFNYTPFSYIYESFLSKITDDMYMELTPQDTYNILRQLLISALPKFEFPRKSLRYELKQVGEQNDQEWVFVEKLSKEEIDILSTYMITQWIGQQLASIELVRMKYSGADFKFTSQANHMQKLLQLKKDYERQGFHLQRLYKRRKRDINGIYRSTFGKIMNNSFQYQTYNEQEDLSSYATLAELRKLEQYVKNLKFNFSVDNNDALSIEQG